MEKNTCGLVSTESCPHNFLEKIEGCGGQGRKKGIVTQPQQEVMASEGHGAKTELWL